MYWPSKTTSSSKQRCNKQVRIPHGFKHFTYVQDSHAHTYTCTDLHGCFYSQEWVVSLAKSPGKTLIQVPAVVVAPAAAADEGLVERWPSWPRSCHGISVTRWVAPAWRSLDAVTLSSHPALCSGASSNTKHTHTHTHTHTHKHTNTHATNNTAKTHKTGILHIHQHYLKWAKRAWWISVFEIHPQPYIQSSLHHNFIKLVSKVYWGFMLNSHTHTHTHTGLSQSTVCCMSYMYTTCTFTGDSVKCL